VSWSVLVGVNGYIVICAKLDSNNHAPIQDEIDVHDGVPTLGDLWEARVSCRAAHQGPKCVHLSESSVSLLPSLLINSA